MNGKRILIVDDSHLIITRLRQLLAGLEGFEVCGEAHSVAAAMKYLSTSLLPDVVLLDINLPDSNGIQLLRYLQTYYPRVHVIMLSNQAGAFYRDLCFRLGAAHYVDKSTEFEIIPSLLSTLR